MDILKIAENLGLKCFVCYDGTVCVRKPDATKNEVMTLPEFLRFLADYLER